MTTDNIDVNTQSSIKISSDAGTIYIDPLEIKDESHDADYILITHDHYDHFSPKDIEKIVKAKNKPKIEKKKNEKQEALYHDIEEKLKASIGTKVTIVAKGDKMGKIEIDFYNQDDLQKIMDLLMA